MAPAFVLVHGYTGSPGDLAWLAGCLEKDFGPGAAHCVLLPGHGQSDAPRFDAQIFEQAIGEVVDTLRRKRRPIVLVGHSTGACLALSYLQKTDLQPDLLVLAGTPRHIDGGGLERWERHRLHRANVALGDVARMVACINRVGAVQNENAYPVLILHGQEDDLVPQPAVQDWLDRAFRGPVQCLLIPGAGHDLLSGPGSPLAADRICRTAQDGPRLTRFLDHAPQALGHLVRSPAAQRALGYPLTLGPLAAGDPIQINLEVTTRCNLACPHCARSVHRRDQRDMDPLVFKYLLDLMPHAYRVVLVGLGEPTLHPGLVRMVVAAAERHRRVTLVTNATTLNRDLAAALLEAGLSAITFSLDSTDAKGAAEARPAVHLDRVLDNIRGFMHLAAAYNVSTAVFSAVSARTVSGLRGLAQTVAKLGVQAWMLSDLNFSHNLDRTVWRNQSRTTTEYIKQALRTAFGLHLPALCVQGLEEFGLTHRHREFLLYRPGELARRSKTRQWCLSPWQTLPVDVNGNATLCDCQPHAVIGNLLTQPFSQIWNGALLQRWRSRMTHSTPPRACGICPRF
jgi:MoaA/NifB/PqqE/SkfB family radical SAM enzyme/pimeloyl-ACP methyl ester carboxylesterase